MFENFSLCVHIKLFVCQLIAPVGICTHSGVDPVEILLQFWGAGYQVALKDNYLRNLTVVAFRVLFILSYARRQRRNNVEN